MLADAFYCNYFLVAAMIAAGVDVLFEQNGARHTDFRRGVSLGSRDHIMRWTTSVRTLVEQIQLISGKGLNVISDDVVK